MPADSTLHAKIPLEITLVAPWLIPGGNGAAVGVDISLARSSSGALIIPGTLLKGVLRGALSAMSQAAPGALDLLGGRTAAEMRTVVFGSPSPSIEEGNFSGSARQANMPRRGCIAISDLTGPTDCNEERGVRVAIDDDRGAANDGQLLFYEMPFGFGEEITFRGDILISNDAGGPSADEVRTMVDLLAPRIVAIGGAKSAGFGQVASIRTGPAVLHSFASAIPSATDLAVEYTLDRPFLVDAEKRPGNLRKGSDRLPGAAIKATLAKSLGRIEGAEGFMAGLHVSDAQPVSLESGAARAVLPISLALATVDGETRLFDALTVMSPPPGRWRFAIDWKHDESAAVQALLSDRVDPAFGIASPGTVARTRTAVDEETGGPLYDEERGGSLFSEVMIAPDERSWRGQIFLPASEACDLANALCGALKAGVMGFGATNAILSGAVRPAPKLQIAEASSVTLVLQSSACLFSTDALEMGRSVRSLYAEYFSTLGLYLEDFMARQSLVGGYLALRYPANETGYTPWVVTEPRSCFRLRAANDEPLGAILKRHRILTHGLPHGGPEDATWRDFPFLRENGYGAIRITTGLDTLLRDKVTINV